MGNVLKQIHEHIKTDFLLIRADIFTNAPLRELLHIHRRENASITLLLSKQSKKSNKKGKKSKNTHIIGTDRKFHQQSVSKGHPKEIERLWFMKSRLDLEDDDDANSNKNKHGETQLVLSKSLLDSIGHLRFTTKYSVPQIGIFCKWILLWIIEEAPTEYDLLYEEAVPYLIQIQNEINCKQSKTDNSSCSELEKFSFPDLIRRASTQNLTNSEQQKTKKLKKSNSRYAIGLFLDHPDVLGNDYLKSAAVKKKKQRQSKSPLVQRISSLPSPVNLAQNAESMNGDEMDDKLKVFGYVYCADNDNGNFSQIINNSDTFLSLSMSLINSIKMFQQKQNEKEHRAKNVKSNKKKNQKRRVKGGGDRDMNIERNEEREEYDKMREFEDNGMLHLILEQNAMNDYDLSNGIKIKNGCVLAPNCSIGTKTKIDKCILEPFVKIGKNCKIDNCVILKQVSIGDNCKISNSIISSYAIIDEQCTIHNCKVAERAKIAKESSFKNETLQCRAMNEYDEENEDDDMDNEEEEEGNDDDSIINID